MIMLMIPVNKEINSQMIQLINQIKKFNEDNDKTMCIYFNYTNKYT